MAKREEIGAEDWARAKQKGAFEARERCNQISGRDEARELGSKLAARWYGMPGGSEAEDAFYQGFMGALGF